MKIIETESMTTFNSEGNPSNEVCESYLVT